MKDGCSIIVVCLFLAIVAYFPASGVHAALVFHKNPPWVVWFGTVVCFVVAWLLAFASMTVLAKMFDGN